MNQIVWPASHNAMSSSAYNFLGAEHTITIPEQLNAGARFLMLDAYYGYDDNGLVRTNLAGGVDRKQLEKTRGKEAVHALDRVGALTGTADTSGKKQDLYFCHDFCELGAVKAVDVFRDIDDFLDANLTDVLVLDFEDYVQPKDIKAALIESGLWDRVRTTSPEADHDGRRSARSSPRRHEADGGPAPGDHGEREARRRLQVAPADLLAVRGDAVHVHVDQGLQLQAQPRAGPTSRCSSSTTGCDPTDRPIRWRPAHVNSRKVLLDRFRTCGAARKRLPNVLAVDFTAIGDLYKTVNELNGAIGTVSDAAPDIDKAIRKALRSGDLSEAQARELRGYRRLPHVSRRRALTILGPVAQYVQRPSVLFEFECENGIAKDPEPVPGAGAEVRRSRRSRKSTSTSTLTTTTAATARHDDGAGGLSRLSRGSS